MLIRSCKTRQHRSGCFLFDISQNSFVYVTTSLTRIKTNFDLFLSIFEQNNYRKNIANNCFSDVVLTYWSCRKLYLKYCQNLKSKQKDEKYEFESFCLDSFRARQCCPAWQSIFRSSIRDWRSSTRKIWVPYLILVPKVGQNIEQNKIKYRDGYEKEGILF